MTSVLIDATALRGVAAGSGVGTYTRGLLGALVDEPGITVTAIATAGIELPDAVTRFRVRRIQLPPRGEVWQHSLCLPSELLIAPGDVFHNPGFHAPWAVRGRFGMPRPWVQTLLDVIPLVVHDPDLAPLRARWKRFGPRYRKADAVIAISRHAADEGIRVLGLDPDRVHVAPLGVDPAFTPGPATGEGRPYVLVVGEFSARKGFAEAFAVIAALAEVGYPHTLRIAGRVHDWQRTAFDALLARAPRPDRVEVLGYVPDLAALYRSADAVLVPSRYEGFGLPALEAMACGAPVVAFANSALPEVVGDGGLLVEDGSVPAMVDAVRSVLAHPGLAQELRERAVVRSGTFSWKASAALHADVYRAIAGGR